MVHSRKYHVRDLTTRSVTLFPAQAQIVRDISDVPLKPGANEIAIVGLTPTVDEDSIKVEGTGSAIITDITVKLLPNRDIYEDIFPDEDEDSDQDTDQEDEEPAESVELKDAQAKLQTLYKRQETVQEDERVVQDMQKSAESRIQFLDVWGKSLDRKNCPDIDQALKTYKQERANVAQDSKDASAQLREVQAVLKDLREEERRLNKIVREERSKASKEHRKKQKAKAKIQHKKLLIGLDKEGENVRQREERMLFWPKKCYTIVVALDVVSLTPGSSRRSSLVGDTVPAADKTAAAVGDSIAAPTCNLSLTYLTSSAFWTPSYDLAFSTASNSGRLYFDAQLTNQTSETWANCKMTLSTSRTALCDASSAVPELKPWGIRLAPRSRKWDDALESQEERESRRVVNQKPAAKTKSDRDELFGEEVALLAVEAVEEECYNDDDVGFALFSAEAPSRSVARVARKAKHEEPLPPPTLEFQEPSFEEAGLTATYELPGQKTLASGPTASKSRIATISFADVVFSHTVVAKYKPAAFLQAKVHNTSKLTLLNGPVGLSLDGSFIGRVALPRCEPGDSFVMGLGVDPAVTAVYARPEVKRGTSGILLARDNVSLYRRCLSLFNTRATGSGAKPVTVSVLDQVPVSQDDRLRVDIALPRGLVVGGKGVAAGQAVVRDSRHGRVGPSEKGDRTWGTGVAFLKQKGEIAWDVTLNPGKGVELVLEYEVACPSGEHVEQDN